MPVMCTAPTATIHIDKMPMLETKDLCYTYPEGKTFRFPDISVSKGEQIVLSGKSGSGKTTLLHLLAGILKCDSGEVLINGTNIQQSGFKTLDQFRGRNTGLIFQKNFFIDSVTMMENLLLAQTLPGQPADREYIAGLLEELGIMQLAGKRAQQLSQGELQRFSVARALANKPLIILADEPTSSLDDENCQRFTDLLHTTSEKHNITLVIATHDARIKSQFHRVISL